MSHKKASTDPCKDLHLYSRIGMYNEQVISVFNADGTDYDFTDVEIEIGVKRNRGDEDFLTLTEGSGITITDNDINFVFTENQSSLFTQRTYYWQLRRTIDGHEKVWLNGDHDWHNGKFDGVDSTSETFTIYENGESIVIQITESGSSREITLQDAYDNGETIVLEAGKPFSVYGTDGTTLLLRIDPDNNQVYIIQ